MISKIQNHYGNFYNTIYKSSNSLESSSLNFYTSYMIFMKIVLPLFIIFWADGRRRYRIIPAGVERLASADPHCPEQASPEKSVNLYCLERVFRTGRIEPAVVSEKRTDEFLVEPDKHHASFLQRRLTTFHSFSRSSSSSLPSRWSLSAPLATTTQSISGRSA